VPLFRPSLEDGDQEALAHSLRQELPESTPRAFEAALELSSGAPEAVVVANATCGWQLAYLSLGLGPGRRVLLAASADPAAAVAALACGGEVEFVDVDRHSGQLEPRELEPWLGGAAAPIVVVAHEDGRPAELERLLALKRRHDFPLLEDASGALGARRASEGRWFRVGEHPEIEATLLSFDRRAPICADGGAALLTSDSRRAARLRRMRALGREHEGVGAAILELGFDHRLGALQSALGLSQLARRASLQEARAALAARYSRALEDQGLVLPAPDSPCSESAWSGYRVGCPVDERDALVEHARALGVELEPEPAPLPASPWFQGRSPARPFPGAEARARGRVRLPLHPGLTRDQQERVLQAVRTRPRLRAAG